MPRFYSEKNDQLSVYLGVNWGDEPHTGRHSRFGILKWYRDAPVYVTSCLRRAVALCSTEAEYLRLSDTGRGFIWLQYFLNELSIYQTSTAFLQDNNSTIERLTSGHGKLFSRRKLVKIRYNFIMDLVQNNVLPLE